MDDKALDKESVALAGKAYEEFAAGLDRDHSDTVAQEAEEIFGGEQA